jgi:hypothetical protein
MDAHVFEIEGMRFVSGLFWQPIATESAQERGAEILSLARELSFDLHVIRRTTTHCVGFGSSGGELKAGVMSAAAVVSKSLEVQSETQNFIFVSELPDGGWMYVIQRDGIILPDGDRYFSDEEEAKLRLGEDIGLGDWTGVFCPESWAIANTSDLTFEELLPGEEEGRRELHNWWKLAPVDTKAEVVKWVIRAVLAVVVIGAILFGYQKYQNYREQWAIEEALRRAQEEQAALAQVEPPPNPWRDMARAPVMVESCLQALGQVNLHLGNWSVKSIHCESGNLIVAWEPGMDGWTSHLKMTEPRAAISVDGKLATVTVPLGDVLMGPDEQVRPLEESMLDLRRVADQMGVDIKTQVISNATPFDMPGQEGSVMPKPTWQEIQIVADGILLLPDVGMGFDLPGFRIRGIDGTLKNGVVVWKIEGAQYVQN